LVVSQTIVFFTQVIIVHSSEAEVVYFLPLYRFHRFHRFHRFRFQQK
jgi:hypothetical protein